MRRLLSFIFFINAFFSSLPAALATSFFEQPFEQTVQDAPIIVRGRTGISYANWVHTPDGGKRIFTFTELSVDEVVKGKSGINGRNVIIRELGGEKDGVGMQVSGTAHFERGEEVVVFLGQRNSDGSFDVRGMMMGKYNIERGEDGKDYLTGAGLMEVVPHGHPGEVEKGAQRDTPPPSRWTLDGLRDLVKKQAEAASQPSPRSKSQLVQPVAPNSTLPTPGATSSSLPAPQLQPQSPEAQSGSGLWFLWIGIVVGLGILAALFMFRQRR